jgi:thiamine-monophosphate kinase
LELEFVQWLQQNFSASAEIELGIGDDAALLNIARDHPDSSLVITHDTLLDNVHFQLGKDDPRRIGRKSLAVNLSDLAAMAARPIAVVIGLALPKQTDPLHLAKELYLGMQPMLVDYCIVLAGGDTNVWNGPLAISVTAFGLASTKQNWRRASALCGDVVLVSGTLGGSILDKHFDFEPRVRESLYLREHFEIHAAMDISDGLLLDLHRMTAASNHGAIIDLDRIPIAQSARDLLARDVAEGIADPRSPLDRALSDGEDFELLLTVSEATWELIQRDAGCPIALTRIGTIIEKSGLYAATDDQLEHPIAPRGYVHN